MAACKKVSVMDLKKEKIISNVDANQESLIRLSHFIHDNPETGLKEYKAVAAIEKMLNANGIAMEKNIAGLETAFRATVVGSTPGPHVAFLAEYDALEGVGHGCGHNIIATCATGAFLAIAKEMNDFAGQVSLIGTPAEENFGSKCILVNEGVFDNVDFALMMHPTSGKNLINRSARATTCLTIHYTGKSAHSSMPRSGINALSAAIELFNGIDRLRPTFLPSDNVNGVILDGGKAANVVPEESTCLFSLRTNTVIEINDLMNKVCRAAKAASLLTGAKVDITEGNMIYERYTNLPMSEAFKHNMEMLGEKMNYADNTKFYGSSDIGNVSIHLPIIHDYLNISQKSVNEHSVDFANDAVTPRADEICIKGAKGLALTVVDILENPDFQKEIIEYQKTIVPKEYNDVNFQQKRTGSCDYDEEEC